MTNIRNEKGDITKVSVIIKRIIGQCYKQLYRNTFDSLDEMDQLFENHKLLKATQDKRDNPKMIKYIEFLVWNISKNKYLGPNGFTGEFNQAFKNNSNSATPFRT